MPNLRVYNGSTPDSQSIHSLDSVEEERETEGTHSKDQQHFDSSSLSSGNDEALLMEEIPSSVENVEPDDGNGPVSVEGVGQLLVMVPAFLPVSLFSFLLPCPFYVFSSFFPPPFLYFLFFPSPSSLPPSHCSLWEMCASVYRLSRVVQVDRLYETQRTRQVCFAEW